MEKKTNQKIRNRKCIICGTPLETTRSWRTRVTCSRKCSVIYSRILSRMCDRRVSDRVSDRVKMRRGRRINEN